MCPMASQLAAWCPVHSSATVSAAPSSSASSNVSASKSVLPATAMVMSVVSRAIERTLADYRDGQERGAGWKMGDITLRCLRQSSPVLVNRPSPASG
jgi:hypothetical protein